MEDLGGDGGSEGRFVDKYLCVGVGLLGVGSSNMNRTKDWGSRAAIPDCSMALSNRWIQR